MERYRYCTIALPASLLLLSQVFEIQQTDVMSLEEGESDYSIVHLAAPEEEAGLPAFHRIVGQAESRRYSR